MSRTPILAVATVVWGIALPLGGLRPAPVVAMQGSRDLSSGATALLQAVSAPSQRVVWVSGHEGVVLRSLNGGETWEPRPTPTLDSLQFRDVHAFDADRAVILSSGSGEESRIYRTADGGASWRLSWLNLEPEGFYDCLDFWDDRRGLAYGDAVDGGLRVLLTEDGGRSWRPVDPVALPAPAGSEGGFAASGTCVVTGADGRAWIGTGAGARPRILRTADHGASWRAVDLPIVAGEVAGAFTVVFVDSDTGYALGGDLSRADAFTANAARTADGGSTWRPTGSPPFPGVVYGSASLTVGPSTLLLAAGPNGLASSADGGAGWTLLDDRSFWAVGAVGETAWAVGPGGRIVQLVWP